MNLLVGNKLRNSNLISILFDFITVYKQVININNILIKT